jgi:hypothetical protein
MVKNFVFSASSRSAVGPTQPPIKWVPGALSLGVKRPGREADHSAPTSAEVKKTIYTFTPSRPSWPTAVAARSESTFLGLRTHGAILITSIRLHGVVLN